MQNVNNSGISTSMGQEEKTLVTFYPEVPTGPMLLDPVSSIHSKDFKK